ncbi:MAG: hypothetical protein K8S13_20435 [Desulfobacula sp.]|uniref:hypothetical protein n=1 Tax=Desulfobacula sp. TaxID=2593537 RepID=UPI0025B9AFDE|nr:hypothetical protein [Desulfobacula sp.]MCD4722205.1 hypothetical protein [Desulfobacula sp.]
MKYKLYPPFLYSSEKESFSDVWELFTCKLLNLENMTSEIYVRNPPEQGIDLFHSADKIAYQCKSIESGKSGDFNVTHAVNSIKSALSAQGSCPWTKFALCTNVPITGTSEKTLREVLPEIIVLPESYWLGLCEKFPDKVERNFRVLLEIPQERLLGSIRSRFVQHYSSTLQEHLNGNSFPIFLFSNRHDSVYRLSVSNEFTINDLLGIFRGFFHLPESKSIASEGINVSIGHSVVHNGKKIPLNKTIEEAGIKERDIVTYWTTIRWKDEQKQSFDHDVIHFLTADVMHKASAPAHQRSRTQTERKDSAIKKFSEDIGAKLKEFDESLY